MGTKKRILPETTSDGSRSLKAIKAEPKLAAMRLVRHSRLSVGPVTPEEWRIVCRMGGLAD